MVCCLIRAKPCSFNIPGGAVGNYTIPGNVTGIGKDAFGECNMTSVTIPDSVTSIGSQAFVQCQNLTNIAIGSRLKNIENGAFFGCQRLTSVTIPASVTVIGSRAFGDCNYLSYIWFKGNVPFIYPPPHVLWTGTTPVHSIMIIS